MENTINDEILVLRALNKELGQKAQYWKMTAAEREREKYELIKENSDLRIKLCRYRNKSTSQARKLESELQTSSEVALTHLAQASTAIARSVEITKTYIKEKNDLDMSSHTWSRTSSAPSNNVLKVPPMMLGGQFIQPIVALDRHIDNARSSTFPTNNSHQRISPLPLHMLQDLYIPLTRVDVDMRNNLDASEDTDNINHGTEDFGLDNTAGDPMEVQQDELEEPFLEEELGEEQSEQNEPLSVIAEDPLEGPSWLLERTDNKTLPRVTLEADSTTQMEESTSGTEESETIVRQFTPTMRMRRKRVASPLSLISPCSPRALLSPRPPRALQSPRLPPPRKNGGRVLQVLLSKIRLEGDAPSPNGATVPGVIISDTSSAAEESITNGNNDEASGDTRHPATDTRNPANDTCHPAADTRHPATDTRNPANDTCHPAADTRHPATDTRHLATDTRHPARDTPTRDTRPKSRDAATVNTNNILLDTTTTNVTRRHKSRAGTGNGDAGAGPSTSCATLSDSRGSGDTRDSGYTQDSDSDGGDVFRRIPGRTRRPRKPVTYKEKPLNIKLRR